MSPFSSTDFEFGSGVENPSNSGGLVKVIQCWAMNSVYEAMRNQTHFWVPFVGGTLTRVMWLKHAEAYSHLDDHKDTFLEDPRSKERL